MRRGEADEALRALVEARELSRLVKNAPAREVDDGVGEAVETKNPPRSGLRGSG